MNCRRQFTIQAGRIVHIDEICEQSEAHRPEQFMYSWYLERLHELFRDKRVFDFFVFGKE